MSDDSAEDHVRVAEEARRMAQVAGASAKERAKAQARRTEAEAVTGETGEEAVRQLGLI